MGGRTDINVAVSRLMVEALRIAKWAEKTGTPPQKDMMRQYVQVTVKVIRNIAPNYADYVIPVWQLPAPEYFTPPPETKPVPVKPRWQMLSPWEQGNRDFPTDNNPFPADSFEYSDYEEGFNYFAEDRGLAANPEGNHD